MNMKQLNYFLCSVAIIAATIFGMTACTQDDMPDNSNREGMVDVTMSTSLPQELNTYAANSAQGGLSNLEGNNYYVRYIMEAYLSSSGQQHKNQKRICRLIKYVPLNTGENYKSTSFNTRLLAGEYDFVFFADIVREVSRTPYDQTIDGLSTPFYANSYFYSNKNEASDVLIRPTSANQFVAGDLTAVCAVNSVHNNVQVPSLEMYDAYSCSQKVDLRKGQAQQSFVLKRPFAKLRLITTDADKLNVTPNWSKSRIDISEISIPTGFNALTGQYYNVETSGYWDGAKSLASDIYSDESTSTSEKTLYVFYLPISAESQNLKFNINIEDASGNYLVFGKQLVVENVPLVANKLTTIKGNLLSKNVDANITIEDEFENDETIIEYGKEASDMDALKAAMTGKNETITYTGNITKADGFEIDFSEVVRNTPVYAEGNTAELTLKFPNIEENAVLTFKGGVNAPKVLRITTETKCSLRINLSKTDINYDGSQYQYIITNSGYKAHKTPIVYNTLFVAGEAASFYSDDMESHDYNINANFTLPEGVSCNGADYHKKQPCTFIEMVKTWLSNNSGKTVWDFVGESNNSYSNNFN